MNSKTYWAKNGRYQPTANALAKLIPASGECPNSRGKNKMLDRFRRAVNCYYDLNNNGLINRKDEFRPLFGFSLRDFKINGRYNFEAIERSGVVEAKMDEFILAAAKEQGVEVREPYNIPPSLIALLERVEMFNRGVAESVELSGLAQQARLDIS